MNGNVNLQTIAGGVVSEKFQSEFANVLENIADTRTGAKVAREINVKIKIVPDESRSQPIVRVAVTSKLAPLRPAESFIYLTQTDDGIKATTSDPKQMNLFGLKPGVDEKKEEVAK